jgi:hypothetical protein
MTDWLNRHHKLLLWHLCFKEIKGFLQLQQHTKQRIIGEEYLISNIRPGGKAAACGKKKTKDQLVKK